MTKKTDNIKADKRRPEGNAFAILFLILPISGLIWVFKDKVILPINQGEFFGDASLVTIASSIILWIISYHRSTLRGNPTLIAASAFFFFLWFIAGIMTYAKVNMAWDKSGATTHYAKIIETRKVSGGGVKSHSSSCLLTFDKEVFGVPHLSIRYHECDAIEPNKDGLQINARQGYLNHSWMQDHAIVKDIDTYKSRLGITDTQPSEN